MKIAPSILDANFCTLQAEIDSLSMADRIHLDIMDGQYVPNLSFGHAVLKPIKFSNQIEAHLMVNNPENFFDMFHNLNCSIISFHIENTGREKAKLLLKNIQQRGLKAGICVDGYTSEDFLDDEILSLSDQILLMSVKAGFGGQTFMKSVLEKTKNLRARGYRNEIEIDGGVNINNVKKLKDAGADIAVVGSFLMKNDFEKRTQLIKDFQAI
ncbi:ribulose-phosphate 3-epimerase [Candidatus Gracilibacteria bacterium]|nr:ribulose-phosphate 3-epimerase [Candidatus Gracilibacteria bacterium]